MSEVYLNYEWGMPYSFLKKINLCKPDEIKFIPWAKLQITGGGDVESVTTLLMLK